VLIVETTYKNACAASAGRDEDAGLSTPSTMKLSSVLPIAANLLFSHVARASPTPSPPCNVSTLLDPNQNRLGAVASESSECTQIGIDILAEGGNAADAIVGTVFCVGVIGMYRKLGWAKC